MERVECTGIRRHCVIREEAADDLAQPLSLFSNRLVSSPSHLLLHLLELCSHAVAPALALQQEVPSSGLPADEGKAQKLEGLRFTDLASSALLRSETAELDQTGLLRMKRQRKPPQPFTHRVQEAPGIALMLATDNKIVGIPHDDHVTRGFTPSPALGPEVESVVQVDVGQEWRDHRALPGPPVTAHHNSIFKDTRLEPFLDLTGDALIADPVLNEPDQPFLAHRVEERLDVGVQYEVHLLAGNPDTEGVERVVRSPPRTEPVREPEEVFLVDRVQDRGRCTLDQLVFQGGDRKRTLPTVRLGDVHPPGWHCPIRSPVKPRVQVLKITLKVCLVVRPCPPIHTGRGVVLKFEERLLEQIETEMVEERSELLLLPFLCDFPNAVQRLEHAFPVLCPARASLCRFPLGPCPSLHRLRSQSPGLVHQLHSCRVGGGALDCSR